MIVFPAIDIKDNKIVRLSQGDYSNITIYGENIEETLQQFSAAGANGLHIVDLDGAKDGKLANQEAISTILKANKLFSQIGGGIRDEQRINHYLEMGVNRVILGTIAVQNPKFVEEMVHKYADKIVVGVDAKDKMVATHGWIEKSTLEAHEFCRMLVNMGVQTIIYTDISKDGMLSGCDMRSYEKLVQYKNLNVVASGGITSLEELKTLKSIGCSGAIVGKAIYEGKFSLKDAVEIC
ncbi:MAG: 1-(5-phosphoribosyl)-5-[(5-phosphoribosylamino)methylideneamino]imidazole-4-carboxamide isomerase [Epulopiscium sp. Nele67-Bin001]|nr:MAG: 1-(5-phosphoribosyl)-5-[(5-phosphoribosylamino)methylideneamino]imidazole-4-carboxamide isomerase [Epulopiscium sp. Nele67-Bin001]